MRGSRVKIIIMKIQQNEKPTAITKSVIGKKIPSCGWENECEK